MFRAKFILIAWLFQVIVPHALSCGIDDFVRAGLTRFPAWVRSNNMDPSPPRDGPDRIQVPGGVAQIHLEISNHGISGYSNLLSVGSIMSNSPTHFDAAFGVYGNVTFHGDYEAFGTLNNKPVSLQGKWYIRTPSLGNSMFSLSFEELPTGYLNVTRYELYSIGITAGYEIYFEGLSDNDAAAGFEEEINSVLFQGFYLWLVSWDGYAGNHPFRRAYVQYWQDVLSKAKMEDIYGPTASMRSFSRLPNDAITG